MSQINPKTLRSNSVNESLAKSIALFYEVFASPGLATPLSKAMCETFLHVNNPEPQLTESMLIALRDVCGEKQRDDLVKDALLDEVDETLSIQTLFRSGSVGTRLFAALYRTEGVEWLSQALRPLFNEVSNLTHPVEFDPTKAAPDATPEDIQRSAQEFEAIARRFFNHLFMLAEDFPPCISRILFPVCEAAEKKFPGRGSSVAGIGLIMLRFVSPAVLQPSQFNVTQPELSPIATRVIIVLSKVIQMVANGVVVKPNDIAMQPIANFIQSLFNPCADFIKKCTANPNIDPLPAVSVADGSISKELRHALKVLVTEIDKNYDKIMAKAKEENNAEAQSALSRYKNPKAAPKGAPNARGAQVAPVKVPNRFFSFHSKQDNDDDTTSTSPSTADPIRDDAAAAAHKALDEILLRFRDSVLAHSGENFSNVVNEFEKCKAELKEEREQRKVAEKMIFNLQGQIQQLQQELAELRAKQGTASSSPSVGSPRAGEIHSPPGQAAPTSPFNTRVQQEPKTPQLNMQSRLPCAPLNRQAVALLDEILMLSARITRVSQVLYLARIVRELQRLIRTPFDEPFEFAKNLAFNPTAGEDSSVSFEDEKMHGLRRAIPDCINKVRDWCVNMLEDGVVSPTYYPSACLRIQNLVDLLKDMSHNLRASVFA